MGVGFDPLTTAFFMGVTAGVWGIGRSCARAGGWRTSSEARTAELREARDERARLEVATDRARLSRELDELLQRRLGELARMAEDGSRDGHAARRDRDARGHRAREPAHARGDARGRRRAARRRPPRRPTEPQPTLTHLEALLVRAKGGDARLAVEGNPRVLPAAVELSAYRIVEQLLAAWTTRPTSCARPLRGRRLELAVSGPARRRAKASIERARERARLQRGTLEATVRGGRAEAVVSLPLLAVV